MLDGNISNVTTGINAVSGIAFVVAAYFLRSFVQDVRAFMLDAEKRITRIEDYLSYPPQDVGSFTPHGRRKLVRDE